MEQTKKIKLILEFDITVTGEDLSGNNTRFVGGYINPLKKKINNEVVGLGYRAKCTNVKKLFYRRKL